MYAPRIARPIHHTYGPHVDRRSLWHTLWLLVRPWTYRSGSAIEKLRTALRETFGREPALFASGREALLALLRALDVRPGQEIIVQGYTCVVVPNAIHAAGAVPIYADIEQDTLNLTCETVESLITPRTRAVICQHTFGIPAPTAELRALCDERGILLIEDLAHVLPDPKGPPNIGLQADFAILSFGRDKAISGIAGGAVLSKDLRKAQVIRELERTAIPLPRSRIFLLLSYAPRMAWIVRPLSGTRLLKPVLWVLNRLRLIVPIVTTDEKKGNMSPILHRIPNACAALALASLAKLPMLNEKRRTLTAFYVQHGRMNGWPMLAGASSALPLQKFPLFVAGAQEKRALLAAENINLDDGWTGCVICPDSVQMNEMDYQWGQDPVAERACLQILSLPTHPTMTLFDARRLARRIDVLLA